MTQAKQPSGALFSLTDIASVLESLGVPFRDGPQRGLVMATDVASRATRLYLDVTDRILQLELLIPHAVGEDDAPACALWVCDVNRQLTLPGFVLNRDQGTVSFRIAVPIAVGGLDEALFLALITTALDTANEHWPDLVALSFSAEEPAQLRRILKEREPSPPRHRFETLAILPPDRKTPGDGD